MQLRQHHQNFDQKSIETRRKKDYRQQGATGQKLQVYGTKSIPQITTEENEYANINEILEEQEFVYKLTSFIQPESLPPPTFTNTIQEDNIIWEPHGLTGVIDQVLDKKLNNKFFLWKSKILTNRLMNFEPDVMILESSIAPLSISSSTFKQHLDFCY